MQHFQLNLCRGTYSLISIWEQDTDIVGVVGVVYEWMSKIDNPFPCLVMQCLHAFFRVLDHNLHKYQCSFYYTAYLLQLSFTIASAWQRVVNFTRTFVNYTHNASVTYIFYTVICLHRFQFYSYIRKLHTQCLSYLYILHSYLSAQVVSTYLLQQEDVTLHKCKKCHIAPATLHDNLIVLLCY